MLYVPAEGPSNAKLAIVGEAPGAEEERLGRPFVGSTGKIVENLLRDIGLDRSEVYLSNVVKVRPPGNKIDALKYIGESIDNFISQLQNEILSLQPNAIIALGNTALTALTGYTGIEKYRGSILRCSFTDTKIIPTIHPASLLHSESDGKLRSWKDLTFIKWDFERALKQSKSSEFIPPRRTLSIAKSALELDRFLRKYEDSKFLSIDIETFKTIPLCIGLSFSSDEAISVPLFNFQSSNNLTGMTRSDTISCWEMCASVLANEKIMKIGQNFKFDQRLLERCHNDEIKFGFKVNSFFFDTMLAFRTLYCELPATLQFMTSVLTEELYYKDEGKEYNPKKDKFDRLLLYNAKDAAVTFEVFEREIEELNKSNLTEFFFNRVMPLHEFYSRLEKRGIKRDNHQKLFLEEKYKLQQKELQSELDDLIYPYWYADLDEKCLKKGFNVMSNGSRGDVPKLLYGLMKIPVRGSTDEKTLDALMRNAVKDPKKKKVIELILGIRKVRKTIGTYIDHEVDYRGRTLTSVRIALETGRTSTNILKPPITTKPMGLAFQTITKHGDIGSDLRSMFIPDEGYIFIEPDLMSAEARVVAILADDNRLLKIFKYDLDLHRITAGWINDNCPNLDEFFNELNHYKCIELANQINKSLKNLIDNDQRQMGKKFRHAGHYDMGKREAARQTGFSEWKTRVILEKFHSTNPNIKNVFHKGIIEYLQSNNRILISPHGRQRQFLNRWGDELFKEAYAFIPQATVSDHLKFSAQIIESRAPWIQILEESHDSFLAQIPKEHINQACKIIKEELEKPIDFKKCSLSRRELIIPCEIKIGENWETIQ